jgi:hypothetical protein
LSKQDKEDNWRAVKPSDDILKELKYNARDVSKTPTRQKTVDRRSTVVKYEGNLSNPYTSQLLKKKVQEKSNPYLPAQEKKELDSDR